jgi:hypothetical protein
MTSTPTSDDCLLASFRRTGKRRASYRQVRNGGVAAGGQQVMLQRSPRCQFPNDDCRTARGELGTCKRARNGRLVCVVDPVPGGFVIPR